MPYNNTVIPPTANTEGGTLPPRGSTGRYLFQDNVDLRSNQISDNNCYPGQSFTVRETLRADYEIYNPKLVTALDRYYIPKYYLGTWQTLDRFDPLAVPREGKCRYLSTIIRNDNLFVMGYKRSDGYTDYGLFKVGQCNFSLFPGTPIGFEIAGVEINFSTYEVPPAAGSLFKGSYAIDRAYPVGDINFRLELSQTGFYTFQGASLVQLNYDVRVINNIPGEDYGYSNPLCPKL